MAQSNRYLDFADIALGTKKLPLPREKERNALSHGQKQPTQRHDGPKGKVTPINSRTAKQRGPNQGFGVFRNTR
jgi:hypothetical protein